MTISDNPNICCICVYVPKIRYVNKFETLGSAWNSAGTWEEKNHSPWAAKRLRTLLTLASLDIPGGSVRRTVID